MRKIIFVLLAVFLAVTMTYFGYPAGYRGISSSTAVGAGNFTWSVGYVVTLFGQVVFTSIQYSYTGSTPPPFPLVNMSGAIAIAFAMNLVIASVLSTVCWLIIKTIKRY